MPRSFGGGRGSFSSRGSNPNVKRGAAATIASHSVADTIKLFTGDSDSCQLIFHDYEECVKRRARSCDFARELKEKCNRFERDPCRQQSLLERQRQLKESTEREAAAGFDTVFDYTFDILSKDRAFCRIAYELSI